MLLLPCKSSFYLFHPTCFALFLTFDLVTCSGPTSQHWFLWRLKNPKPATGFTSSSLVSNSCTHEASFIMISSGFIHVALPLIEFINIIRPANILISHKNIPVIVDFGFAEKYDMSSDTAFHSNLSYGTPEVSFPLVLEFFSSPPVSLPRTSTRFASRHPQI